MTAVQRNLLNGALRHHLADRDRRGLDERRRAADRDVFGERADTQPEIEGDGLRDAELDLARLILKALDVRNDLLLAGRERGGDVLAVAVGHGRALEASGDVAQGHRDTGHHRVLCISDGSLQSSGRLRPRGREAAEQDRNQDREPHHSSSFVGKATVPPGSVEKLVKDQKKMKKAGDFSPAFRFSGLRGAQLHDRFVQDDRRFG
jgi:hypothetical protein